MELEDKFLLMQKYYMKFMRSLESLWEICVLGKNWIFKMHQKYI